MNALSYACTLTIALTGTALLAAPAMAGSGCCSSGNAPAASLASMAKKQDIVDIAASNDSFETLVAAVKAAGLVDALKGDGPFTVFAPTDDAFAKLPKGTIKSLLQPENRDQLTAILTYHVVPGKLTAAEVISTTGAVTLQGQRVNFATSSSGATIDNAGIIKTDIIASNGVIHVIDTVILPTNDSIVDVASSAGTFNTLLTAAKAAGLADVLANDGPFTVFAPTDEAFSKLPDGTVEMLLQPENRDKLAAILKYHVIAGRAYSTDAASVGMAKTLEGSKVTFSARNGALFIDNARILKTDIDASNGVVHVIDSVILPKSK
jgi:uncharacterized surface protein with fasciclin (FAS1) repeats